MADWNPWSVVSGDFAGGGGSINPTGTTGINNFLTNSFVDPGPGRDPITGLPDDGSIFGGLGGGASSGGGGLGGLLGGNANWLGPLAGGLGAYFGSNQQVNSANQAANTEMNMYNQTRQDLMPFTSAGANAINALQSYWGLGGGGGGYGGGGTGGGGYLPNLSVRPQSQGGHAALATAGAALGNYFLPGIGGLIGSIGGNFLGNVFGMDNRPYIDDIKDALSKGLPVRDSDWAKAGPEGQALRTQLTQLGALGSNGTLQQPTSGATGGMGGGAGGAPTAGSAAHAFDMLKNYPGYQFQYDQGLEALKRSLNATGRYTSGAMLQEGTKFGQGQAESAVGNYLAMLQNMSQLGANAASSVGGFGANAARGIANSQTAAGTAKAAGTTGITNSIQDLIKGVQFGNALPNFGGGGGSSINSGTFMPDVSSFGSGIGNAFENLGSIF